MHGGADRTAFVRIRLPYFVGSHQKWNIYKRLLRLSRDRMYRILAKQNVILKVLYDDLAHSNEYIIFEATMKKVFAIASKIKFDICKRHKNKLFRLRSHKKLPVVKITDTQKGSSNFKFTNYSAIEFNNKEIEVLNKGYKYNYIHDKTQDFKQLCVQLEAVTLRQYVHSNVKKELGVTLSNYNRKAHKRSDFADVVKDIRDKLTANNLIVTPIDKGGGIAIIEKDKYINKVEQFCGSNDFKVTDKDPTSSKQKEIRSVLNKHSVMIKEMFNVTVTSLINMNPSLPHLYALIKAHKEGHPIRPIISSCNSATAKLSKLLAKNLKNFIDFVPTYTVRNSVEFADRVSKLVISNDHIMASLDICNMFTNIPVSEAKTRILEYLKDSKKISPEQRQCLLELINIAVDETSFKFNGRIYSMNGLPMGNNISPFLADLFLHDYEVTIHASPHARHIVCWERYVDDVFLIWNGSVSQLHEFHEYVNSLHHKLSFTLEIGKNASINYLDLTLQISTQGIEFGIYHKATSKDIIIPYDSNHHIQHKLSVFHCLFQRLNKIPLTKYAYNIEYNRILTLARDNGYPVGVVLGICNRIKKELMYRLAYKTLAKETPELGYISINYFPDMRLIRKLQNIFKKYHIKLAFKNSNVGHMIINNNLDKQDILQKSGVYQLKCLKCNAIYIGETGRQIKTRIKEHKKDYVRSNMGRHLNTMNHKLDEDDIRILHHTSKGLLQSTWEAYEIEKCFRKNKELCLNDRIVPVADRLYRFVL